MEKIRCYDCDYFAEMTDSVAVERFVQVQVEKPLSALENAKLRAFWWLVAAIIILIAWTKRKRILKLIL